MGCSCWYYYELRAFDEGVDVGTILNWVLDTHVLCLKTDMGPLHWGHSQSTALLDPIWKFKKKY